MSVEFLKSKTISRIIFSLFAIFTLALIISAIYQVDSSLLGFEKQNSQEIVSQSKNFSLTTDQPINGNYSAQVEYQSPGGQDIIQVQINIQDNLITDVEVSPVQAGKKSTEYIQDFNSEIDAKIVGKSIEDDLDPGLLSGASLTQIAFLEAVIDIREQIQP